MNKMKEMHMATTKQGKVTVMKSSTKGKGADSNMVVKPIEVAETDGTIIKAGYGLTRSKNYNSVKVEVGIEYPTTVANIRDAFGKAWKICEAEMAEQVEDMDSVFEMLENK